MAESLDGRRCPICQEEWDASNPQSVCVCDGPRCATAHHVECWNQFQRCAMPGCDTTTSTPAVVLMLSPPGAFGAVRRVDDLIGSVDRIKHALDSGLAEQQAALRRQLEDLQRTVEEPIADQQQRMQTLLAQLTELNLRVRALEFAVAGSRATASETSSSGHERRMG